MMYFPLLFSKCNRGRWVCQDDPCSASCSVIGYSHIQTFDGERYEFQPAACEYTLIEVRDTFPGPHSIGYDH